MPAKKKATKKAARTKPKLQSLTLKQTLNASPAEVSRLFTHAAALRDWLCDWATVDGSPNGIFQLRWGNNIYVSGHFLTCQPGQKLVMTWDAKGLPSPMKVSVTFKPQGESTLVTLTHSDIGSGSVWKGVTAIEQAFWQNGLENLKSVVETGIDLRIARRPRLGVNYDAFSPEVAAKLNVPVKAGFWLTGVAEGTGAHALGLQKDDVIFKFNGKPVINNTLEPGMQGLKAGDTPPVEWYRGSQKLKGNLKLGSFPIPSVPETATDLAETMRKLYVELDAEWAALVEGVTETEAEHKEGGEWSVKELIAHFIAMERDYQSWLSSMVQDNVVVDWLEMRPNTDARLRAMINRFQTVAGLLAELRAAEIETVDFIANLPDLLVARKHYYRRAALWELETIPNHLREDFEHAQQIRTAIAAAKK